MLSSQVMDDRYVVTEASHAWAWESVLTLHEILQIYVPLCLWWHSLMRVHCCSSGLEASQLLIGSPVSFSQGAVSAATSLGPFRPGSGCSDQSRRCADSDHRDS